MESNILLDCAREFDNISDYNYLFTIGRAKKIKINISLSCANKDFTHIIGLDHLSDIKELSSNKSSVKLSAFHNILSGKLTLSTIRSSGFFQKPFPSTYNSSTKTEYMLIERITALKNISEILDNAYKGEFYKWNKFYSNIKMPDGKIRRSTIGADYMLAVPSTTNPQEKIYFFMYEGKSRKSNTMQLYIFSAFPDCLDLSQGQEHPYTILSAEKENIKTKQVTKLYTHPRYIEGESAVTPNLENTKTNISVVKFSALPDGIGNAAVLAAPRLSFGQALANLINKWADKIQEGIENRRRELQSAKEEIAKLKQANSKLNAQLNAKNDEIAVLHKQNTALTVEVYEQKKLIQAANPPKTLLQKLEEAKRKSRERNAKNPPRPKPPNQNHHKL